jgi:hypothetical protein
MPPHTFFVLFVVSLAQLAACRTRISRRPFSFDIYTHRFLSFVKLGSFYMPWIL